MMSLNVKIMNEKFGTVLDETFANSVQFKLFLKMIHGCIELKNDLSFFNGEDFLIHIPHTILSNSIVITKSEPYTLTEHILNKSKIESHV